MALFVRITLACTLFSFAFSAAPKADADQWAEEFKAPFASQIINVLNGNPLPPPAADNASLATIAGVHVGDAVLIDGTDGQQYAATIQSITPQTHRITWTPALPGGVVAKLNQQVRSTYSLSFPKRSAIDASGNVYTTDTENHRIVAFDNRGRVLWTLGQYGRVYSNAVTGGPIDPDTGLGWDGWDDCSWEPEPCPNDPQQMLGRFYSPAGIDVSPDGSTIVVSDQWNDRIQVFTLNPAGPIHADAGVAPAPAFDAYAIGGFGATHDGITAAPGRMYGPSGVSLDAASGRIVVADEQYNHRIQIFTPAGGHSYTATVIGSQGSSLPPTGPLTFLYPEDVEFDRSSNPQTTGRIIVADAGNNRVVVLNGTGQFICAIGGVNSAELDEPLGVTVDDDGRIYVADLRHSQIKVFTPAGATSYVLESAFGAEQTSDPVPGELLFISPTGVAISGGRLIVTEQAGQRVQYLTRSGIAIDSVEVDHNALTLQDPEHDHVHVTVTARNTGAVDLVNLSLAVTPSYLGIVSPVTASSTVLEAAGGADTVQYSFDFTVTGPAVDGTGFANTLIFKLLAASASAGNVTVTSSLQDFDTGVTIARPAGAALAFGDIAIGTIKPGRAGIGEQITITVPVQNVGTDTLHDVVTTVTVLGGSTPPLPVSPGSASYPTGGSLQLAPDASSNAPFTFVASAAGTVRFSIHTTAVDAANNTVTADIIVPAAPGIEIVADNIAPTVVPVVDPQPHAITADGFRWHNSYPMLSVMAADSADGTGVTELHWKMLSTGSQQPSDDHGTCALDGADKAPSSCTPAGSGAAATLTWIRHMAPMQGTIVIAFWAEDAAGNGALNQADQTNCGIATCVTLHIDVDPPALQAGAPVFTSDNTQVSIPFIATDDLSRIASMTSPNAMQIQSVSSGVLFLTAEGEAVTGSVIVTDYAGNARSYVIPVPGPGRPVIRLDHTPPEAFNRLDPAALGRRCTTTIAGQPVSYLCTNKVYGTDNLPGLTTAAFAPVSVISTKWGLAWDGDRGDRRWDDDDDDGDHHWGDDDDHDWDGGQAEIHTYSFTDAYTPSSGPAPIQNPNQVTLIEKVRQSGNEARIRVLAFRYRQGSVDQPLIVPRWATKKYEWSTNADGSLKSLQQKFELHKGRERVQVTASFDTRSGLTTIRHLGHDSSRVVAPGLILLRMTTDHGQLRIDYDVDAPVAVPDLAPPVLKLPPATVVEATSAAGAAVNFTASAFDAYDNSLVPVTCTSPLAATFPLGTTTVGCSASDLAGNVAQGSFTITVRDTKAPVLTLPATITRISASPVAVTYSVSATDAVTAAPQITCSPASGSTFKVATTNVTCTARDAAGNTATGSFAVVVKKK